MSIVLVAASLLLSEPVSPAQSTQHAGTHRVQQPARLSRRSDTYPQDDLLAGQPNLFPGVEWRNIRIRTVGASAFPGVEWQPAGHCRGPDGLYGLVYRAAASGNRPTEEVSFYYQKIVMARPSNSNIGSSGDDGVRRTPDSFFDVFTDLGEARASSSGRRSASNIGSSGEDGVRRTGNRHGNLTVSNIGSSGEDGVRSVATTSVQWPYRLDAAALNSSNYCPRRVDSTD